MCDELLFVELIDPYISISRILLSCSMCPRGSKTEARPSDVPEIRVSCEETKAVVRRSLKLHPAIFAIADEVHGRSEVVSLHED